MSAFSLQIFIIYFALVGLIALGGPAGASQPLKADWMRIHRAAWSALWIAVSFEMAARWIRSGDVSIPRLDFHFAWLAYLWTALFLAARHRVASSYGPLVALTWIATSSVGAAILFSGGAITAATTAAGLAAGLWVDRSIRRRDAPSVRKIIYWFCFVGTFFGLWPLEISRVFPEPLGLLSPARWGLGTACALAGIWLSWVATRGLTGRKGGTPDPSDAPTGLRVDGLYAIVRNPMQIGQSLLALASAAALGTKSSFFYAAFVVAFLFTFVRLFEETALAVKYGAAYERYRASTPAFFPRWRRPQAYVSEPGQPPY